MHTDQVAAVPSSEPQALDQASLQEVEQAACQVLLLASAQGSAVYSQSDLVCVQGSLPSVDAIGSLTGTPGCNDRIAMDAATSNLAVTLTGFGCVLDSMSPGHDLVHAGETRSVLDGVVATRQSLARHHLTQLFSFGDANIVANSLHLCVRQGCVNRKTGRSASYPRRSRRRSRRRDLRALRDLHHQAAS